ncbi:MAG: hypothetical protein MJ252_01525 [archaeon]|nr:hypothetical protein [archaeon]
MASDFSTPLEELYSTARNFNKLTYSNEQYAKSMEKETRAKDDEILELKQTYEKLKGDVRDLKSQAIYSKQDRAKSAGNQYIYLRMQYDLARNNKLKSIEEWKKNTEKYNQLKEEAKLLNDDNNPYIRRMKLLQNKLEKAMIKYNEALTVKRTYAEILARLKEERAGYDNQIAAIQNSLRAKNHDLNEFKLLLQDSEQAKIASDNLVKGTKESQIQFDRHYRELVNAQKKEATKGEKAELPKIKPKKNSQNTDEEKNEERVASSKREQNQNLEQQIAILKDRHQKIVSATGGVDDINEICQKFSNLKETTENLETEKADLIKIIDTLKIRRHNLSVQLNKLKFSPQDEITRKEIEEHEATTQEQLKNCEMSRQKLKKEEKLIVDIRSGIETLVNILKDDLFAYSFTNSSDKVSPSDVSMRNYDKDKKGDDITIAELYKENIQGYKNDEQDIIPLLINMNELFKFLCRRIEEIKEANHYAEEEDKIENKENQELENVYIGQSVESNDSEYCQDDEFDNEIATKDQLKKNDLGDRPYTTNPSKTRSYINARDKMNK